MYKTILIVVIVLAIGIGGYFALKGSGDKLPQQQPLTITIYCTNNNCSAQQVAAGAGTLIKGCYRSLSDCTADMNLAATTTTGQVTIKNFSFSPNPANIKVGTTVVWVNQDSTPHQIKSGTFNSGILNKGDSFQFKFDQAGTYDYSCAIHPSMKGAIIVSQ